jgi:Asp-tRNA(Asn)/Glu-tRNA(Gln) amidotransferase A subunit family amidase
MCAGSLSCRALVEAYLQRIGAFDKRGPAINAIITVNPDAVTTAAELDRKFARRV